MKKYWQVMRNTWEEITTYRINFIIWRVRVVLQILTLYFFWFSIVPQNSSLFGYSQQLMLTYILGVSILTSVVFSTRTQEIGENINNGDLSIFLIRPINYFFYWFWRDFGDKLMNVTFSVVELFLLFIFLHPPLFIQTNPVNLLLTLIAVLIAIFSYFLFGCLLGLIGFWSPEVWGPRFIFMVILSFFAGGYFPLDILPKALFYFLQILPFSYFLYFPLKIYLGQIPYSQIYFGFFVSIAWAGILFLLVKYVWKKGLKVYSAEGR